MSSYLVTGAGRGLGLEFALQLAAFPASEVSVVYATIRGSSTALDELVNTSSGRVVPIKLDLHDEASIQHAAKEVEARLDGKGLDVLINNAGIQQFAPDIAHMDNLEESFKTNVLGVHWVTRTFLPLLRKGKGKKICNISSTVGSIAYSEIMHVLPTPAYKITKAALNSMTVQYSLDYKKEGFVIFCISPGWLRTDLGGERADLPVEQGAKASLEKIMGAGPAQNGQFLDIKIDGWVPNPISRYDGTNVDW